MHRIDLNGDLGESFGAYTMGRDSELLDVLTSANIACGFHAGDPATMRKTVAMCLEKGVSMGAHPGLPDLVGFGRRNMAVRATEVYDMVVYQLGALNAFVRAQGARLKHVKPHGALYNMAAKQPDLAEAIARAVYDVDADLILYGLSGSALVEAGRSVGLRTASEVFADRTYQADGSLTSRQQKDAMLNDASQAAAQVIRMVKDGAVRSQQGDDVPIEAETVCIHGDGPHAMEFAQAVRQALAEAGVEVRALE